MFQEMLMSLEGSEAGGHIGYVSLIILLQQVVFEGSTDLTGRGSVSGRNILGRLLEKCSN
jgi:hypothetical protein